MDFDKIRQIALPIIMIIAIIIIMVTLLSSGALDTIIASFSSVDLSGFNNLK